MKLHGSITDNLEQAVASARRLRGHPVYKETPTFWTDLIHGGRRVQQDPSCIRPALVEAAIAKLEAELADRAG